MNEATLVRVASKTLAIYLASWAILDCTYLPQYTLLLVHHLGDGGIRDQSYWKSYYMLETASLVLRIAVAALAAIYFWNGGPRIMHLFSTAKTDVSESLDKTENSQP